MKAKGGEQSREEGKSLISNNDMRFVGKCGEPFPQQLGDQIQRTEYTVVPGITDVSVVLLQ